MKLNPIEKSEHFSVQKPESEIWHSVIDKNGKEIMIFRKEVGDKAEFFKTGCYIKIDKDRSYDGRKCYGHLFFTNDGRLVADLEDLEIEGGSDWVSYDHKGFFDVEVEINGLKILFAPRGGLAKQELRFTYEELKEMLAINNDKFFDKIQSAPQKN